MINSFDDILKIVGKVLSPEQRSAVFTNKATIVSAGAGSGKTTVLSLRFLRLIYERATTADRILTLTFTRKAAAEMYERIYMLLQKASREDESGYLKKELEENFPKAQISTLDGFWGEIARAGALSFGINRDFTLLEGDKSKEMTELILSEIAEEDDEGYIALSSILKPDDLVALFEQISGTMDILSIYDEEEIMSEYVRFKELLKELADSEDIRGMLDEITAISNRYEGAKSHTLADVPIAIEYYEKGLYSAMPNLSLSGKRDKEISDIVVNRYRPTLMLYKMVEQLENKRELESSIAKTIASFIKRLQKSRRSQALLSYSDIERIAKETLIKNKNVREYYKRRFDYIMIDEFQDNNNKQKEILYLLSESLDSFNPSIPTASELDKNKLFFVGDDKQSIYRFRGSDVAVFNALKREVVEEMSGLYITLGANYRSEPELVEHYNNVFSDVFGRNESEESDEKEESLIAAFKGEEREDFLASPSSILAGRNKGDVSPVIELDILPELTKEEKEENDDLLYGRECEAEYIARRIEHIVTSDEFNIGSRNAAYDDIAILYSVTKTQMDIEKALRRHNIPYSVAESTSITVEAMASDFFSFLQLLVYPNDKTSFLRLMKSPFVRLSDEGMLNFLGDASAFKAFEEIEFRSELDQISYDSAKGFYELLKASAEQDTLTKLIELLYYNSGYYTYISSSSMLSVYNEHFDYIWALAENADKESLSLPMFLDQLRPIIGDAEKLENITTLQLSSHGVSLMTIHKSKGLEFPIVIVACAASGGSKQESKNMVVDFESKCHFVIPDVSYDEDDEVKKPLAKLFNSYEERRVTAERSRVLYVALTRAINHLIITAEDYSFFTKKGEPTKKISLYKLYKDALDSKGIKLTHLNEIPRYKEDDIVYSSINSYSRERYDKAAIAEPGVYIEDTIGVKEANEDITLSSGALLPRFDADELLVRKPDLIPDFGTLLHAALESKLSSCGFLPYNNSALSESELEVLNSSALSVADNFIESDFYKRYIENKSYKCELKFYFPSDEIIMIGQADLVVDMPPYSLIIDYKSDRTKCPEIHKGQLTSYAKALEEITHKKCYGMLCYLRDFSSGPIWDKAGNEVDEGSI